MAENLLEIKKRLDEIKHPGSVAIKKSDSTGSESAKNGSAAPINDPVANVQRKKEEAAQPEAASVPSLSEIRADAAKKNLERYLKSDKRKEFLKKQQQNLHAQAMLTGITDGQWTPEVDETEKKIRNEIDYWETEAKKERDAERISQQMAEIDAMDEQEKAAFDKYASKGTYTTAEEIDAYKNLKNKYGDRLDELVEARERTKNQELAEQAAAYGAEKASTNGGAFLHSLLTVPASLVGGITGAAARINDVFNSTGQYETLAENTLGDVPMAYANAVRSTTQKRIEGEDPTLGRKALSTIYQGGMSALDTAARTLTGSPMAAATLAGTGIFASTMQSAAAQGASQEQALALAAINSGIEAATEKLPLDELFKVAKGGAKPAAQVVKNVLKQMGIEILEEEASLIGTTLAEAAILQEKSGYNQQIMKAAAMGVPYEQAKAEADRALLAEAINTALVSGVAGFFGAAGAEYAGARYVGDTSQQETTEAPQTAQVEAQTQTQENAEQPVQEAQEQPQAAQEAPTQAQPEQRSTADVLTETITGKPTKPAQTSTQRVDTQGQSAEGGQVKGIGAAEADFSGKPAYNASLSADNAQADRSTDMRPMELPKQDINGGNVSATTGNVYGSQNTPDDLASAMEEPTARGDFSYIRITNDQATQRAQKTVESAGSWEEARLNFRSEVDRGSAGAEISARGALILNHYGQAYEQAKASGDEAAAKKAKQEWLSVLSDVQKLGTNTAQGLQAMRIIRNLMPQDKLEFAKAAVRNMVRDMKLNVDIQISENLLNEYENATTDKQRDEIIGKIQQNVADQIPSTMLDKWNALRYTNMLGNLKTTVARNTLGNAGNSLLYRMKDTAAATIEYIANKATKGKVGRTKSVIVNKNIQKACGDYYDAVKNAISSGGKYGEYNAAADDFRQGVMGKRRIFKSDNKLLNTAMMPMETYRKVTNWAMNNKYFGDEAFGKAAFTRAMAGYLQANGVKPGADLSKVDSGLIEKAMTHAVKEAQEATFHDNSALANVLGKLKKDAGAVGEGIMPFTKTPANVLTRAEEFSPLGIINTAVMAAKKAAGNSDITGTDIINSLSKTLTGTAVFALGAALKSGGMLTGGPDEDEDEAAFNRLNGIQDYALTFTVNGETYTYTMDWLTPAAMPMFMGSQFMELASQKDLTFADLEEVFTSIANPMLQMSMLQGLNDSLESIKYSENNLGQFFINAAVSYLTQGLTNTMLGQVEKSMEPTRTTTYVDKESQVPQWLQKQLGKASQKIPGWDYQQTEYINARGETEEQPTDAMGWLYNLTSPGYLKKVEVDDISEELYRLNDAGVEGNVFPESPSTTITYTDKNGDTHSDYTMTPEQADKFKREVGQMSVEIVGEMVKSKDYKALNDEQKALAIQQAYSYARKTAEIAAIEDHTGYDDAWMIDMQGRNEAAYIMRRIANNSLNSAFTALDTAWDKGYNEKGRSDRLEWAYDAFKAMTPQAKKEVKEWATGTTAKYIEARESGITHDQFLSAAENVAKVTGTGSNGTVRDIDRRQAIAKTSGLTEQQKDKIMKVYMEDYDPTDESPATTELKYDYIRHGLGLTAEQYAETYRASLDHGKKNDKIAAIMELGYDKKTATALYNVYGSTAKGKTAYMGYYNSK